MASIKDTDLGSSSPFTDLEDVQYNSATMMDGIGDECYKQHKFSFNSLHDLTDEEDNDGVRSYQKVDCIGKSGYMKKKKVSKKRPALNEPSDDDDDDDDDDDGDDDGDDGCNNGDDICRCPHVHIKCFIENKLETGIVGLNDIKHGFMKRINTNKPKFKGSVYESGLIQSSTTPSNDSHKSGVTSDQASHISSPISVIRNDDFSQCLEDFHAENINKICSDLEQMNMFSIQQTAQTFTIPDPDVTIAKQIKFFAQIYEILHSFTSLNNFLIFKYNNNLSLDNTTDKCTFQRFDNFNEFVKKSTPLLNFCQKFKSTDVNDSIDFFNLNKQSETIHKLKIDNRDMDRLESELQSIKSQLASSPLLKSFQIDENSKCSDNSNDMAVKSGIDLQSLPQATQEPSTQADSNWASNEQNYEDLNERCRKYERLIQTFVHELDDFVSLHTKLKKINSKEYKIMSRGKYNSLKFQVKAYKNDYKQELKEKCHYKQLTLSYQNKISKSKGQNQVYEANMFNNSQDIMIDF